MTIHSQVSQGQCGGWGWGGVSQIALKLKVVTNKKQYSKINLGLMEIFQQSFIVLSLISHKLN